jgi:putative transposase
MAKGNLTVGAYRTFFLTLKVRNEVPIFRIDRAAHLALKTMRLYETREECFVIGFVIMPNHLHLLVSLKENRDPVGFVESFKRKLVQSVQRDSELSKDPLFQQLTIEGELLIWGTAVDEVEVGNQPVLNRFLHYIHLSPTVGGLVREPADYLYSSARWYS